MIFFLVYLAGVIIGLAVMRDRWPARVVAAMVWPLGPMAFIVVVSIMLIAAAILWPLPILSAGAAIAALAWWLA
jgi:hypothetical protein